MNNKLSIILLLSITLLSCSCMNNTSSKKGDNSISKNETTIDVPIFNADSAYNYVTKQVEFGPRVPNTKAHTECANYLTSKLEEFGATVHLQKVNLVAFNDKLLNAINIIGSYNVESKKRIALFAHWDSRPWADNDPDSNNHHQPILGANDGASGVGVLLEIARQINMESPTLGIDIIFFDAEDYGAPQFYKGEHEENDWCLGSQHWANNPHTENYNARYGILLDMVGGKNAVFYKEQYSEQYAPDINNKIWQAAKEIGYGNYFVDKDGSYITDDHLYVNQIAKIKTVDIISTDPSGKYTFNRVWHTVKDDMSYISKETLEAVGQTVMQVIYTEQ